jgi:hypothetical protein
LGGSLGAWICPCVRAGAHGGLRECSQWQRLSIHTRNVCIQLSQESIVTQKIERDDFELSRLVDESLLSEEIRDKMRVRYDQNINFYDYPGGVLLMMTLEISNASVSYDFEGAQVKLDQLTLSNYPGEDVSAFCSDAQKQIKVMQIGYVLPIRVGSKLLMKCTKTDCEYENALCVDCIDCMINFIV